MTTKRVAHSRPDLESVGVGEVKKNGKWEP